MAPETITIPYSEYKALQESDDILTKLYAAGVDNWEGYSFAFEDEEDYDDE